MVYCARVMHISNELFVVGVVSRRGGRITYTAMLIIVVAIIVVERYARPFVRPSRTLFRHGCRPPFDSACYACTVDSDGDPAREPWAGVEVPHGARVEQCETRVSDVFCRSQDDAIFVRVNIRTGHARARTSTSASTCVRKSPYDSDIPSPSSGAEGNTSRAIGYPIGRAHEILVVFAIFSIVFGNFDPVRSLNSHSSFRFDTFFAEYRLPLATECRTRFFCPRAIYISLATICSVHLHTLFVRRRILLLLLLLFITRSFLAHSIVFTGWTNKLYANVFN